MTPYAFETLSLYFDFKRLSVCAVPMHLEQALRYVMFRNFNGSRDFGSLIHARTTDLKQKIRKASKLHEAIFEIAHH